jgi:hypothetical protein
MPSAYPKSSSSICPVCGQEAPIVYKGVVPHCTACGAVRAPLSSASVNLAGKTTRVGSTFATVFGWLVLVFGLSTALGMGLLLGAVLGWTTLALALGLPIGLFSLVVGVVLVRSGGALARSATRTENETMRQGLLAMAAHRGAVTARDAAQALNIGVADADAMLTALAKSDPDRVAVDVDDQGNVWYRVAARAGEPIPGIPRVRVGDGPRVEVGADAANGGDVAVGDDAAEEARRRAGR